STKGRPSRSASRLPMEVLPAPMGPTSTRLGDGFMRAHLNNRELTPALPDWPSRRRAPSQETPMAVAKVIELNASSKTSMEDAVKTGLAKCAETVNNIKGAWVNEIKVVTGPDGSV